MPPDIFGGNWMESHMSSRDQRQAETRAGVMRLAEVKALTGRSRSSIYEDMAAHRFPSSIRLGPRAIGWLAEEVDAWIAARVAERDSASKDRYTKESE